MPNFSDRSEQKLATCHPDLQLLCRTVIQAFDFTILCGWRGEAEQNAAYPKYTKVKFPNSKHNNMKDGKPYSLAVDVIPYDPVKKQIVSWESEKEFCLMAGFFKMAAYLEGIEIIWGHDWNNNNLIWDEVGKLKDLPHIEILNWQTHI
jgi:peptidoglycan L-alanyl-D-glutamate endopeptidase CwlK